MYLISQLSLDMDYAKFGVGQIFGRYLKYMKVQVYLNLGHKQINIFTILFYLLHIQW